MNLQTKINMISAAVESTGGRVFSVTFTKKDGSERTMNCRTKVTKHLRGGQTKYNGTDKDTGDKTIGVYEMNAGQYRAFKASSVKELKIDGNVIAFA